MLTAFAIPFQTHGGFSYIYNGSGDCRNYGYEATYLSTTTIGGASSLTYIDWYRLECASCTTGPCQEVRYVQWLNEPYGPGLNSLREVQLLEFIQKIRVRTTPRYEWRNIQPPLSYPPCRNRASLDGNFFGIDLIEASPAFFVFEEILTQVEVQTNRSVPLIIERKGDEDWLELSVNGTNFLKQALADLTTNLWYEVEVPTNLLVIGKNTYAYFLNSAGDANSSIFFPMGEKQDARPRCGGLAVTNAALELELKDLVIGFDYTVVQSGSLAATNWQSILSFTATNNLQIVTPPFTNTSSMFYRAALPIP